ncbi:MAG TPA: cellulase family glycosylhydrolase, partial [Cellvibrio sp.]|nr:cellulase family glycosylhydrolase [Cellvibrio sp.]
MKMLTTLKKPLLKKTALALLTSAMVAPAFAGWTVNGTQVLDPNGNTFIFRGVNHAHTWYADRLTQSLKDIAATGANSVRVVLSNGTQWTRNNGADVTNVINQCKANKLVCVLEVHDSTGYGESAAATHISRATEYWLSSDIKAAITGQEDYVVVNIANEPFGNSTSATTYTNDTITAVRALRAGGLTHMLMVDAANWGQDWQNAMRDNAPSILAADSLKNTLFSVHMYEVYSSASIVQSYLSSFQTRGLAIVVGEFGAEHNGNNVAEDAILQYAQDMGIGYLG